MEKTATDDVGMSKQLGLRLPPKMMERINKLANKTSLSISDIVRLALISYLDKEGC